MCTWNMEFVCSVWPEILAGRYFGGLLKICHLAEFVLAVEPDIILLGRELVFAQLGRN